MTSNERAVAIAGTVNSDNIFTKITTVKINGKEVSQDLYASMLGDQIKCQEKECPETDCQYKIEEIKKLKTRLSDVNEKTLANTDIKQQLEQKNNEIKAKDEEIKKLSNFNNDVIRGQLKEKDKANKEQTEEIAKLKAELDASKSAATTPTASAQEEENKRLQGELKKVKRQVNELDEENSTLVREAEKQKYQLSSKEAECEAVKTKLLNTAGGVEVFKKGVVQGAFDRLNSEEAAVAAAFAPGKEKQKLKSAEKQRERKEHRIVIDQKYKRIYEAVRKVAIKYANDNGIDDDRERTRIIRFLVARWGYDYYNKRRKNGSKGLDLFIKPEPQQKQPNTDAELVQSSKRRFEKVARFYNYIISDKSKYKEFIERIYSDDFEKAEDPRIEKTGANKYIFDFNQNINKSDPLPNYVDDWEASYLKFIPYLERIAGTNFPQNREQEAWADRVNTYFTSPYTSPVSPSKTSISSGTSSYDMPLSIHAQAALQSRDSIQKPHRKVGMGLPGSNSRIDTHFSGGGKFTIKNRHKTKHRAKQIKKRTRRRNKKLTRKV